MLNPYSAIFHPEGFKNDLKKSQFGLARFQRARDSLSGKTFYIEISKYIYLNIFQLENIFFKDRVNYNYV